MAKTGSVRVGAVRVLCRVVEGHTLPDSLGAVQKSVAIKDHALLQELCYGTVRWWHQLSALSRHLIKTPLKKKDRDIGALVLLGFYQLRYMRIPDHAVVSETVSVAGKELGKPWATGLVNGVLRRFLRDRDALMARIERDPVARWSHPKWLIDAIEEAWPEHSRAIFDAANSRPPMTLRVNLSKLSREDYLGQLSEAGMDASPVSGFPSAVILKQSVDVERLPGFIKGRVSVQDAGAQLAAELLDAQEGQNVLDACAAPGGKSGHILERTDCHLTAVDWDAKRLTRVEENLARLGLQAQLQQDDAAAPSGEWAKKRYDRILLDVPCSATGVIRRNPDIKLLRRREDVNSMLVQQEQLLNGLWPLLQPGGRLLYATCSLLPEENSHQMVKFLSQQTDAQAVPLTMPHGLAGGVGIQTLPATGSTDGFYYACLEKKQ